MRLIYSVIFINDNNYPLLSRTKTSRSSIFMKFFFKENIPIWSYLAEFLLLYCVRKFLKTSANFCIWLITHRWSICDHILQMFCKSIQFRYWIEFLSFDLNQWSFNFQWFILLSFYFQLFMYKVYHKSHLSIFRWQWYYIVVIM